MRRSWRFRGSERSHGLFRVLVSAAASDSGATETEAWVKAAAVSLCLIPSCWSSPCRRRTGALQKLLNLQLHRNILQTEARSCLQPESSCSVLASEILSVKREKHDSESGLSKTGLSRHWTRNSPKTCTIDGSRSVSVVHCSVAQILKNTSPAHWTTGHSFLL